MKAQAWAYWGALCESAENQKLYKISKSLRRSFLSIHLHLVLNHDGQWVADRMEQVQLFAMHFGHSLVLPGIPYNISCHADF